MMKALIKEERGTAIILVALMMVVLAGFAALAIDGGNLYYRHTKLQDIADSCALAACHQLGEEKGDIYQKENAAFNKAVDYIKKYNFTADPVSGTSCANIYYKGDKSEPGTMEVTFPEAYEVKVKISINSNLYFARILSFNQTPVGVSAKAGLVVAEEHTGGFAPLCFFWPEKPTTQEYTLNLQPGGGGESGNYGYLDYQPGDFYNYLQNGYPGTLGIYKGTEIRYTDLNTPYNTVPTYTGADVGQLERAIEYRINYCQQFHGGACTPDNFKKSCPRIVIFPLVENFIGGDLNGKSYVRVVGFVRFFITDYIKDGNTKTLKGQFIDEVDETTANGGVTTYEYLVQSVKLIE